jgi:hypothetical protein
LEHRSLEKIKRILTAIKLENVYLHHDPTHT